MKPDTAPVESLPVAKASIWQRLHRSLMPDYNRKATFYWWTALLCGGAILSLALHQVLALPAADLSVVLAGVALAMLAGYFPIRIPRWTNSFTAGEIFIFLLLLLHGPAAAALAAAGEGVLGSWRTSRRWTSRLGTPAMSGLAMYLVGTASTLALRLLQANGLDNPGLLLLMTMASAIVYFGLSTLLFTAVAHLKRNAWPQSRDLLGNFGWVGITYSVSASVACLLFLSTRESGLGVLMAAVPIIALLLVTLHYHFRQRDVDEAARLSRLDAAEREAQLAAAHVRQLQASEQRFHSAFSHASIGMALVTFDARILQANAALAALLGIAHEAELAACAAPDFVEAPDAAALLLAMQALQAGQTKPFAGEFRLRHAAGGTIWAAIHGSLFTQIESDAPCLILQVQDITARREAEIGLQHIAYHDSLTGLPNRHRFGELLEQALQKARANAGKPFGLMFLDFDRFKLINDSLGHAVGDQFLVAVARRIQHQLRPEDIVARLGGDEFAVLAEDLDSERYAVGLADRMLDALRQPFHIAGTDLSSSVSIGITFSGTGYTSTSDMLRDADTAMYKAKAAGKGRYALFDSALHTAVAHRMRLESDLRHALAGGQIAIEYQPIFELGSGGILGFEALARWHHPELGVLEPQTFIPVAEESGLMVPLTDFVLRAACRQLGSWQRREPDFRRLCLHVNVSGVDVAHPNLVGRVNSALQGAGLQARDLILEMTENTLMERLEGALPALNALRNAGVGLSVDDFGTGYSSLRHLSSLPVNGLKLAPGFVADLGRGASDIAIVQAIVLMAGSLGKSIIAEGIETAAQAECLQRVGCRVGQGYHLSRPLTAAQVDAILDGPRMPLGDAVPSLPTETVHSVWH